MIAYLYALLGLAPAAEALGELLARGGSSQEPLSLIEADGVRAVVGALERPPAVTPDALRAHDEVARRLAEVCPALLPARFGQAFPDEAACRARLTRAAGPLRDALALVDGCVQVSLRLFAPHATAAGEPVAAEVPARADDETEADADLGPGARYLHRLADAARARAQAPELAPLRPLLDPLVRAERVRRARGTRGATRGSGPAGGEDRAGSALLVSIYHLVPREALSRYTEHLTQGRPKLAPLQLTATGPWPAYAFAPEPLDALASEVQ